MTTEFWYVVGCSAMSLVIGLFLLEHYQQMVKARNRVIRATSSVQILLKRRYDLLPNLVSTVGRCAEVEIQSLSEVSRLRAKLGSLSAGDGERTEIERQLSHAVINVFSITESYPQLKASRGFERLQQTLEHTEDEIAAARRISASVIARYNDLVSAFPAVFFSCALGFDYEPPIEFAPEELRVPNTADLWTTNEAPSGSCR